MKFNVPEMSCGHCTSAIEKAVKAADPAATVACDLDSKEVTIDSALSPELLRGTLKEAGYESAPVAA